MKKQMLLSFCFVMSTLWSMAQGYLVTGTVVDDGGVPIIGANVIVKDMGNIGTATNVDGTYSLMVPEEATVLTYSFLGYSSVEIPIQSRTVIDVTLTSDALAFEEVVVVGYGAQKKVSVTGSVAAVDSEVIMQAPSSSVTGALTGRLPGLTITQSSGQPGAENFKMRLRGVSTLNGQDPLVLVDGVPREDNISMMDPNEIESISILKDASATAVFGVRGANGVILITTKTGTQNKPALTISAEYGLQSNTREIDMPSSWEYATMRNEALANEGSNPQYSDRQIALYKSGENPKYYPNVDYYDLMYRKFAPVYRANVNYSGGTDRVRYFATAGFINQESVLKTESKDDLGYDPSFNMKRYNFRANLDIDLNSWIKTSVKLSGYVSSVNEPATLGVSVAGADLDNATNFYGDIYAANATIPVKWGKGTTLDDGTVFEDDLYFVLASNTGNPYAAANRAGYKNNTSTNLNSTLAMDFDLDFVTKGLSAKVQYSFDTYGTTGRFGRTLERGYTSEVWDVMEVTDTAGNVIGDTQYFEKGVPEFPYWDLKYYNNSSFRYNSNLQLAANYTKDINEVHHITGLVLGQYDDSQAKSGVSKLLLPYRRLGLSARATYNYDYRYMAEFNMGYNGSEQFAPGKRFGFFPAASLGWVISNEEFLKNNDVISNLKLRASYGKVGSDQLGKDRFLYLDEYAISPSLYNAIGNAQYVALKLVGNEDLTWEIAYKQNYGVDLGLFHDQLKVSVDYFVEDRQNILLQSNTTPTITGNKVSAQARVNSGRVYNHGVEAEITLNKAITKDLFINIGTAFTYSKNHIVSCDELSMGDDYAYPKRQEGFAIGQPFGYLIDWNSSGNGYFTSQEEIDEYTYIGVQPRVGDFKYQDITNDGIIDARDEAPIGHGPTPNITGNLSLGVTYKNFDISALFYGVAQVSRSFDGFGVYESVNGNQTLTPMHMNAWTPERFESGAKITYPALSAGVPTSSQAKNDFFIEDTSYIRLKNVEVGYNLSKKQLDKIGLKGLRVYFNGSNLFTHDSIFFSNFDPENTRSTLPLTRTLNLGVKITL